MAFLTPFPSEASQRKSPCENQHGCGLVAVDINKDSSSIPRLKELLRAT